MFENLYTTKMSTDRKKLQNRFSKIRSRNGRISKMIALFVFAFVLATMALVTIIFATNFNNDFKDYSMSESEFYAFVNRPIGSDMADIYYANESKFVFHYGEGLFIIHTKGTLKDPKFSSEFDFAINLKKLNIAYAQQGSKVLDIKISKDGTLAYLSALGPEEEIKDYDTYVVYLDTGFVKKAPIPENAELFEKKADTFTTVQNPVGWYSTGAIVGEDNIYYLTSENGLVKDIQLITVNKTDNKITQRYVFGNVKTASETNIKEFEQSDISDIINAELFIKGVKYPVAADNAHKEIEKMFSSASLVKVGGTACPFEAQIIFTKSNGQKGYVTIATDSCAVFKSKDKYYDYSNGDNTQLLGYFGLDWESLYELTTGDNINNEKTELYKPQAFIWPCNGDVSVSNRFGTRTHPITGEVKAHNGVDIKAPEGTDVMSAIYGTVKDTGYDKEKGYYVIVERDNIQTVYASLTNDIKVKTGESVTAGQVIGKVGMTGTSTGAHLHFEVLINGEYYDPELIE